MISSAEISIYVDTLLVETALSEPKIYKKGGVVSDLLGSVKTYFESKIDPQNPVSSILDILAPGALWMLFSSLGLQKWGLLLGLLMNVFHVDVTGLIKSLYNKVRNLISGGKKVSSSEVDAAVESTAQEFSKPATPEEIQNGYQALQKKQGSEEKVYSSLDLIHHAKIINLAMTQYEYQNMRLTKQAIDFSSFSNAFSGTKSKSTSLLARILGWIVKLALSAGGLLLGGDLINKFLDRPNSLDHTYQAGQTTEEASTPTSVSPTSTQNIFKFKANAILPPSWPLVNTESNIENMIIQFAKDTYDGLDGKENIIKSVPAFQSIKEQIEWYNIHNPGSAVIFIPGNFKSKKQLVDYFIDEVAQKTN